MNRIDHRKRIMCGVLLVWAALLGLGLSGSSVSSGGQEGQRILRKWIPTRIPGGTDFAGTQACQECHQSKAKVYETNPMSFALERVPDAVILKANQKLTYQQGKYRYEIVRQGDQSIYTVTDGVTTVSEPILYSFGQGQAGQTYVIKHRGEYYESRVSYYRDVQALDLTIGYLETRPQTVLEAFGRKLSHDEVAQCFSCHATNAVSNSQIHLEKLQPGITCEGCHGPGGDHIAAGKEGLPNKDKIFNPGKLSGDELSQEFCGACHRSIEKVITRNTQDGIFNVRFQPYRIFNSKCYSDDKRISCLACHSPHEPLKRDVDHYDAKCMACHQSGQPKAEGTGPVCRVGKKDCASCHMPKMDLPGAHFKFTDHRIRIVRPGEPYPN